jgi:hypothetical protein
LEGLEECGEELVDARGGFGGGAADEGGLVLGVDEGEDGEEDGEEGEECGDGEGEGGDFGVGVDGDGEEEERELERC